MRGAWRLHPSSTHQHHTTHLFWREACCDGLCRQHEAPELRQRDLTQLLAAAGAFAALNVEHHLQRACRRQQRRWGSTCVGWGWKTLLPKFCSRLSWIAPAYCTSSFFVSRRSLSSPVGLSLTASASTSAKMPSCLRSSSISHVSWGGMTSPSSPHLKGGVRGRPSHL